MLRHKKAEMGIGTLIIFIALLLVAAVAAGVLIQTSGSLQERALTTGDQAKGQIATNIRVVEVSATDGSNGNLEIVEEIAKLSPGSNPIKLSQVLITLNTFDATATLQYRGTTAIHENNISSGYYTVAVNETIPQVTNASTTNLAEDYDVDGQVDTAQISTIAGSEGLLQINFSGGTSLIISSINCTNSSTNITGTYNITSGNEVEQIVASGICGNGSSVNSNITLIPDRVGEGFFTAEYLQQGNNPVVGNLQTGDIIKIYIESPRSMNEDEEIRLNFIPKIGTPTLTQFITPEVISSERIYLYP